MCPICITAAVLTAAKVTSASGAATLALKKFRAKSLANPNPGTTPPKEVHHG
jgi:hypothetical protein